MDRLDVSNIYTGGFCDGVRELLDALRIAIESAPVGERLPAIERVMEQYETEYRDAEYGKK